MTLVATNVAARGLDINDVQLIIQVCVCVGRCIYRFFAIHVNLKYTEISVCV